MTPVELSLFAHRLSAICDEMGALLRRSALSPNIKDREDYSCALFDPGGELVAQAAHIPVHLGSMAYCMRDVVARFEWRQGDVAVFNDPFLGGTHLPDITVVAPFFAGGRLLGFTASRAHHADVGGVSPGSMGVHTSLEDEGVIISPDLWFRSGVEVQATLGRFLARARCPDERMGDLSAQKAACAAGARRLLELNEAWNLVEGFDTLLAASEAYGVAAVEDIPDGVYAFHDEIEDDGLGNGPFDLAVTVSIRGASANVDFSGTSAQCAGPMNCPMPVTAAAVYYAFRCLMPAGTPQTSAIFRPVHICAAEGSIVNARHGAAVAAGNVETSQRIVDIVLGALAEAIPERIPAASQGTMNNVLFGGRRGDGTDWVYYETLAGGMGAHAGGPGLSAVQCHMTNTKNTSIEVLEMHYPLRIAGYGLRSQSGGEGLHRGGEGIFRQWEALADCSCSLLSERRASRPFGLHGGKPGRAGRNILISEGREEILPAKCTFKLKKGDMLRIETPGGGGYGPAAEDTEHDR